MRIVLVNWALIADGATSGGGVNGYCRQLALELVSRGHHVAWLSSGMRYVRASTDAVQPCEIRRSNDCMGVQVYEVLNSPVVAPGIFQAADPASEISSPPLESELARFLSLLKPHVVHFHNIEGLSAGCITVASRSGAKVFYSLHNYHTVCPQVYLMQQGRRPCTDFQSGHACVACVNSEPPVREMRRRAGLTPDPLPPPPPVFIPPFHHRLASAIARRVAPPPPPPPPPDPPLPGRPVRHLSDVAPTPAPPPPFTIPLWLEPLSNQAFGEPTGNRPPPNEFGRRRIAFTQALSACDGVIAVSDFVRSKFAAMGVAESSLETLPIGTRMTELVAAAPYLARSAPPLDTGRPIRAVFMGYNNFYKGLHMFLDSLDLLTPEHLACFHLFIWAKDLEPDLPRLAGFEARLAGLSIKGHYRYEDIPAMLCNKDLGVVPSVWWDNGPQTVMEYLACGLPVLAAAVGGIPDLIRHEHNGLLFPGNDRAALASALSGIADNPARLDSLRLQVRSPRTMQQHADDLLALYQRRGVEVSCAT